MPIHVDDDADSLTARILVQEHVIYPQAVRWIAEKRVSINDEKVTLNNPIQSDNTIMNPLG